MWDSYIANTYTNVAITDAFNSLCEIHGLLAGTIFTHQQPFQFSMWDSGWCWGRYADF